MAGGGRKEYELLFKLKAALGPNYKASFQSAIDTNKQLQQTLTKINSITGNVDKYKKLTAAIDKNKLKLSELNEEYDKLQAEIKATENPSEKLLKKFERTKTQIEQTNNSIKEQEGRLEGLGGDLRNAGVNTNKLEQANEKLAKSYEKVKKNQETLAKLTANKSKISDSISSTKSELLSTAGALGIVGTAFYAGPIKSSMDFQSAMADVVKVVDGLKDKQTGQYTPAYQKMRKDLLDLSTVVPIVAKDLTAITAAAGQAGIARQELVEFTKDAAKMGVAFDTTAEQSGTWMAKWRTSFAMTQKEVVGLADKINALSDSTASEANEIANIVMKVGPLGEVAGIASGQIAAMGAALVSVGIQDDVAATGIKKLAVEMTAGESVTKRQAAVLDKLGISATGLADKMQVNAQGAILEFLTALGKLPKAQQTAALSDYFGTESVGAIAPLLTRLDLLKTSFELVGDSTKYAGSMEREFASRSATTENKVILAKNSINKMNIVIGNTFLPYLGEAAEKVTTLVSKFADFANENPQLIRTLGKVAVGLAGFKIASLGAKLAFLEVAGGVNAIQMAATIFRGKSAAAGVEALGLASKLRTSGTGMKAYFGGIGKALGGVWQVVGGSKLGGLLTKISGGFGRAFAGIGGKLLMPFTAAGGKIIALFGNVGTRIAAGPLGKLGMMLIRPFMSIGRLLAPLMNLGAAILGPFGGLFAKIFPVVGVIMLIISVVQILRNHMEEVRGVVKKVFGEAGLKAFDKFIGAISNISKAVQNLFTDGGIQGMRDFIDKTFGKNPALANFLNGFITVFGTVGNIIGQFITFVDTNVRPVVESVLSFIVGTALPMIAQKFAEWAPTISSIFQSLWVVFKTVGTAVFGVIQFLMPSIKAIVGETLSALLTIIGGGLSIIKGVLDVFTGVFTGNWKQAWEGVKGIFGGAWEAMKAMFKAPLNFMITGINTLIRGLNKVKIPDWVPGIGGKGFAISEMPMFAKGTNNTPDTFIAGENGAELITGAKGKKVFTAAQTGKIFNNLKEKAGTRLTTAARTAKSLAASVTQRMPQYQLAGAGVAPSITTSRGTTIFKITNSPVIHITGDAPNDLDAKLQKNNNDLISKIDSMNKRRGNDERRVEYD